MRDLGLQHTGWNHHLAEPSQPTESEEIPNIVLSLYVLEWFVVQQQATEIQPPNHWPMTDEAVNVSRSVMWNSIGVTQYPNFLPSLLSP